ncbi:unnamed protein product [Prorocentrum cordatum]|uniref:Uncharacterized protein n=1 Tax=Prorocentrum cordatum TaxID=2364126 RepID=A0ABN9Q3J2_9DINO|nr:unnamed protein product [Polarella glacialis]
MSWRKRAPWHNGGKGWNKSGKSNQKPYDVCADCGHWEYHTWVMRLVVMMLAVAMVSVTPQPQESVEMEPPVAVEPEWSTSRLQDAASAERTRLTRVVEDAAKAVRLASQEVHHRKTKVQKLEQLAEAKANLATDTAPHQKAQNEKTAADLALQQFKEDAWIERKRLDQRKARGAAAAAARAGDAPGAPAGAGERAEGAARGAAGRGARDNDVRMAPETMPNLGEMGEEQLRAYAAEQNLPLGLLLQFQGMAKRLAQGATVDLDAGSDAGDLPGPEAEELKTLRKRACAEVLGPDDMFRMEHLMVQRSKARTSKRLKTAADAASADFADLVRATVAQMPAQPGL